MTTLKLFSKSLGYQMAAQVAKANFIDKYEKQRELIDIRLRFHQKQEQREGVNDT